MKKIILCLLIAATLPACNDLLEETPKDFISSENFYKTEEDLQAALNSVYQTLWVVGSQDEYYNYLNLHTDYAMARGSFTSVGNFNDVLGSDTYARLTNFWRYHYRRINRANVVIDRAPLIVNISDEVRSRIVAQAHFLRAFSYFHLVRYWGAVPIRTKEFSGEDDTNIPRAPIEDIYKLILDDLAIAEGDLASDVGEATGKASKWAAKILLAQVRLDREEWQEAADKANEVIESGNYELVRVHEPDDVYKIFAVKTASSEDIMSYHFSQNVKPTFQQWYHAQGTPYNRGVTFGFTNLPNPDSPFILNWSDDDLRKDFNLYSSYVNDEGQIVQLTGVGSTRYKKFIKDPNGDALYIVPLYRIAEAYLMYAEAAAMANGSPTALAIERLNMVKRRGYGYDPNAASPVDIEDGLGVQEFRDIVIQERGYEFFIEWRRWWDLKRTGKAATLISEASGLNFSPYRLLFPIPLEEMATNKAISQEDQNPGY